MQSQYMHPKFSPYLMGDTGETGLKPINYLLYGEKNLIII